MARSLSNAKIFSAFAFDNLSVLASRRGYAAASQDVVSGSVESGAMKIGVIMKKGGEESTKTTSWIPDPVTGCYRPESQAKEVDAAELRAMLLKHKIIRRD